MKPLEPIGQTMHDLHNHCMSFTVVLIPFFDLCQPMSVLLLVNESYEPQTRVPLLDTTIAHWQFEMRRTYEDRHYRRFIVPVSQHKTRFRVCSRSPVFSGHDVVADWESQTNNSALSNASLHA